MFYLWAKSGKLAVMSWQLAVCACRIIINFNKNASGNEPLAMNPNATWQQFIDESFVYLRKTKR
jgi:hypothetical protein